MANDSANRPAEPFLKDGAPVKFLISPWLLPAGSALPSTSMLTFVSMPPAGPTMSGLLIEGAIRGARSLHTSR